jgi:hypothetical protein
MHPRCRVAAHRARNRTDSSIAGKIDAELANIVHEGVRRGVISSREAIQIRLFPGPELLARISKRVAA